jgi:hypothetical protein
MPVHGDVGDIGQDARRPVAARLEVEKLGRLVDELRVVLVVQEGRVLQQVLDEGDVRRHAPDAELPQRPVHPRDGGLGRRRPCGDLLQQAVVVARDDRAGIGRAAVETDAHPRRAAIGGDAPVIGNEVVGRILGRDPALDGVAIELHVVLRWRARGLGEDLALGDQDLRAHDVDAGDFLGHGVLDLHAGVHLDEVEGAGVHIHQELDSARALIVHVFADLLAQKAELLALGSAEIGGGRAFDDLLVAPLDGAVALVEVVDVARDVAEDLHLHVAGAQDHLLEVALAIAEGGLGLAPALAAPFPPAPRGR